MAREIQTTAPWLYVGSIIFFDSDEYGRIAGEIVALTPDPNVIHVTAENKVFEVNLIDDNVQKDPPDDDDT